MKTIGFRCSNSDLSYAILEGDQSSPKVIEINSMNFPKNYEDGQLLNWFYQEVDGIINQHTPDNIGIRCHEGMVRKKNPFVVRMQIEGMIFLCATKNGIDDIASKTRSTIAKDLGTKGKASYLNKKVDFSVIPDYAKLTDKKKEAVQVALSML